MNEQTQLLLSIALPLLGFYIIVCFSMWWILRYLFKEDEDED